MTTAYGVEGVTDELIEAIQASGVVRVLIAFDRDDAGERGAAKLAERLMALGIDCFRVVFPKGMDANEYAAKVQPAAKSLGLLVRKAEWMGKGQAPKREAAEPEVITSCDHLPPVVPSSAADAVPKDKPAAEEEAPTLPAAAIPAHRPPTRPRMSASVRPCSSSARAATPGAGACAACRRTWLWACSRSM